MSASTHQGASDFARAMEPVARELLGEPDAKHGNEWRYGSRGSLRIRVDSGVFEDHETGAKGGVIAFLKNQRNLDKPAAVAFLQDRGLLPPSKRKEVATYPYTDEAGALAYEVVRFDPKNFSQRRPNGNGGWIWKMAGVQLVPYRLPRLIADIAARRTVYIVEGEKGVEALHRLEHAATCSPGGAGKWRAKYNPIFAGADVVVLPDNDPQSLDKKTGKPLWHPDGRPKLAGQDHAADIAASLQGIAAQVRVLELPNLPLKGDVADWIEAGGTAAQLAALANMAPDAATWLRARAAEPEFPDTPERGQNFADRVLRGDELPPEFRDEIPPECTDEALALRFSDDHAHQLRHVAAWGKWMEWDGTRWRPDGTLATFDRARKVCRRASSQCENIKVAARVASASTVAAVERLAKADRRHAATVEQWDADPWALNTLGGTVNLKTGKMRKHNPADHLTKSTAVAPGGECPMWHQFLATVTNNDAELQAYIKRMAGYALTGSIREHALFFAFGTGANGKGVCINTLTGIMGDYAAVAGIETFTASLSDRHPTDLAMLRGARLVTAQETEEGRRWAESRIKAMTGGDPITARFMRQDFFTFQPTFKLLIAGNHRPGLRGVDEAIRRRLHLIPFAIRIALDKRDLDLPEKLKAEWPGILKWAIEGCLEWQRIGLKPPAAVLDATAEYLDAEDAAGNWQTECCIEAAHLHTAASVLFASWKAWAEAAGEFVGSQKGFTQKLIAKGFEAKRMAGGKSGFLGMGLQPPPSPEEPPPHSEYD